MIRVVALTSGKNLPASRFRIRQFIAPLAERGIEVQERHLPFSKYVSSSNRGVARLLTGTKVLGRLPGVAASRAADVTWLERELVPGRVTLEGLTGRPRLFDVDDALWMNGRPEFSERIAASCDGVIAGNEFLADHYRRAARRIWIVPTSIDPDVWTLRSPAPPSGPWTVGWIGTSANLPYLEALEPVIRDFLGNHPGSILLVVSNLRPSLPNLPPERWRFEEWSAEREVTLVQEMNVGLMPLPDTDWARGKCSCKMLSYMAVGIPAVVSPVGTNQEILARGSVGIPARSAPDWYEALDHLWSDREAAGRMGTAGRAVVEESFSVGKNVETLARIFHEFAQP